VRLSDTIRKWRQPPLWLPLISVVAPDVRISVSPQNGDCYVCALGHKDLVDLVTIITDDRLEQRKGYVLASTE
jgi:hypothetical protein